jgi:hypothetical protein
MEQLPKIVHQRLQATAPAGVHPDPDLLTAFAEKSLTERERTQVLQHLGLCADCRQVVALAMPEMLEPSAIPARTQWFSWPVLRWGALAACVVVVSAAVTLHYERRESAERVVAPSTPAPAAPAPVPPETLALQGQVSQQLDQKLAAKITPPSPFQSDRDELTAGKLAKQREDTAARSAAIPSVSKSFEVAGVGDRLAENNPQRLGQKGIDQGVIDQLKRQPKNEQTKDEQSKAGQLNDNRLATARADAITTDATRTDELKAANKPATVPLEQMAASAPAPAPAPAPAAESKSVDKEAQAKPPGENPGSVFGSVTETVTVEAEATQIQTSQASVGRGKKAKKKLKNESREQVESAAAAEQNLPMVGRNVSNLTTPTKIAPSWTVSSEGAVQRSFDSGKTWQTIPVVGNVVFRALAANDADVWAGGGAGALYHSSDAGEHWTQIKPVADGKPLTADILTVQFSDALHGSLTTADRETWTTSDAGQTWHK